jgi:hypothetical protein
MSAPDPNELGKRLKQAADAATPTAIDVDEVLQRSRARRRSRRTAALSGVGAVAAVLAVGGLVLGLQRVSGPTTAQAPAFESAESAEVAPDAAAGGTADDASGTRLMAPELVNRCGAQVATPTDAATSPLAVAVTPPVAAVPPGSEALATVTITNTGPDTVSGDVRGTPALTVAEAGITVWHSSVGVDVLPSPITLAPGESTTLEAAFEARGCAASDDLGDGLPTDLPPLLPGGFAVGAVVSFTDASDGSITYLVSPLAPFSVG